MENNFTKPEKPFFLLSQNAEGEIAYSWYETEEELQENVNVLLEYGDTVIKAIEIGSCRTVEVVPDYLICDFIEDVYSAYETAKEQGIDHVTLAIKTKTNVVYYINETGDGFKCKDFNQYFDDLDSISSLLYYEKKIGKIGCGEIVGCKTP